MILGAAGVLGSALTEKFLNMGFELICLDVCRINEAWRLNNVRDAIEYNWKGSNDLQSDDVRGVDVIVDGGLGVADRPLGNMSPAYTLAANVHPPLQVLETIKHLETKKPVVIYPSSFNALYGHPNESIYDSKMLPNSSSLYGWTKAAVELLYMTYFRAYGVPYVITRVGSGYGPRMRSDELPARLILDILRGNDLIVRSPSSKRLWTYIDDITHFYEELVKNLSKYIGQTLHCAGNAKNEIVTNMSLAKLIVGIGKKDTVIGTGTYEPGELIDGKPLSFSVDTSSPLWKPQHSLEQGMTRTYEWFERNITRYG